MEDLSLEDGIADEMADDMEDGLVDNIATTSIMHNFIVSNPESVAKFAKALEEAFNDPPRPVSDKFRYLQDPDEIREFMNRLKQSIEQQDLLGSATQDSSELESTATLGEVE